MTAVIAMAGDPYKAPDANGLDAQSANLQTGIGLWANQGITQPDSVIVDDPYPGTLPWGTKAMRVETNGLVGLGVRISGIQIPLTAQWGIWVAMGDPFTLTRTLSTQATYLDAGEGFITSDVVNVPLLPEWFNAIAGIPVPATATQFDWLVSSGGAPGDGSVFYVALASVRDDGNTDFYPAYNEPAAVDVVTPSGVPVEYTPGIGLVIGDGYNGDLELYQRFAEPGGQILAELNPADVLAEVV